ncbi:Enolase [Trema orientale]|uniref:phosphopyruvate hydratase n=1 Tax=Trema orientale TaxID=63057 RepID=A0A2P5DVT0_TREOI|nr:Enolase [Trema orientale]
MFNFFTRSTTARRRRLRSSRSIVRALGNTIKSVQAIEIFTRGVPAIKIPLNVRLAVSVAVCKTAAHILKIPLYKDLMIIIKRKSYLAVFEMHEEFYETFREIVYEEREYWNVLETTPEDVYTLQFQRISGDDLKSIYKSVLVSYPIVSIEHPFHQDDMKNFSKPTSDLANLNDVTTSRVGHEILVIGDDLLVTDLKRLEKAIEKRTYNALLVKMNRIGTITKCIEAVKMCKNAGWNVVMASHDSGETTDTFIADLSVGLSVQQIRFGAPSNKERRRIYDRIFHIEQQEAKPRAVRQMRKEMANTFGLIKAFAFRHKQEFPEDCELADDIENGKFTEQKMTDFFINGFDEMCSASVRDLLD